MMKLQKSRFIKMDIKKAYKAIRASNPKCAARFAIEHARRALACEETTEYCLAIPQDSGAIRKVSAYSSRGAVWNPVWIPEHSRRRVRWCEDTERAALRFVGFADEIAPRSINHTGWFTDDDGMIGETLRGAVWQLPARDGVARFVGGYCDPNNDGAAAIELDIFEENAREYSGWDSPRDYEAAREAAHSADGLAEIIAENERDHNRYWQASRDIEEKREEILAARSAHSALIGELSKLEPSLARDTVKLEAARVLDSVRDLRREISELFDILPNGEIVE
jgi:hypothetical protein